MRDCSGVFGGEAISLTFMEIFIAAALNALLCWVQTSVDLRDAIGLRLKQLAKATTEWEQGAYKTANEGLYVFLQSSYQLYKELTDAKDENLIQKKQGLND